MVAWNDDFIAVGQFAEPQIEVPNLRSMIPKGEIARMN
jgi:hypothetical protein